MDRSQHQRSTEISADKLESAFAAFNSASSTLAEQYALLERRISTLTEQLMRAHDERDRELAEKNRLAHRLSGILSALPGGVLFFAGNGRILDWNKKAVELLGIDLTGKTWRKIAESCFTQGVLCTGEVVLANGRNVSLSIQPLINDAGKIVLLSDVTESRNIQEGLKHKERLSEIGQMVGKLAHQIRTPLASAFLYLSGIRKQLKSEEDNQVIDKLHHCLGSVQHTLDDLLLYVRGQNPVMTYCCISAVIDSVKAAFASIESNKNVRLDCIDQTNNRYVYINKHALEGALLNLLINAVQAGSKHITLRFSPQKDHMQISVEDDGSGVSAQNNNRVFDAFFTTRSNGTGLGLAIVKTVAELHGGQVGIDKSYLSGTKFVIELPDYTQQCFIGSSAGSNQSVSIN